MRYCRHRSWLLSGFAALMLATAAQPQNPPQPLPLELIGKAQIDEQQKRQICDYAKYWNDLFNAEASSVAQVERARDELIRPLAQPNAARVVSPIFRGDYSTCVVPEMDKALKGDNLHRATNAALVLSQLGTDKAVNALLPQGDIQNQSRWQVRLHAASGAGLLLQLGTLDARKVQDTSRKLRDAAAREDRGEVLRHHFKALNSADSSTLQAADRTAVRIIRGEAVKGVINHIVKMPPSTQMIEAVGGEIAALSQQFLTFDREKEQMPMGQELGPALGKLLVYVREHWDALRSDSALKDTMPIVVARSEGLLQIIDQLISNGRTPPSSSMNEAWRANDKVKFDTGIKAWEGVLSQPPYKP